MLLADPRCTSGIPAIYLRGTSGLLAAWLSAGEPGRLSTLSSARDGARRGAGFRPPWPCLTVADAAGLASETCQAGVAPRPPPRGCEPVLLRSPRLRAGSSADGDGRLSNMSAAAAGRA